MSTKVIFNSDEKWDIQLSQGQLAEFRVAELLTSAKLERVNLDPAHWRIEVKTEGHIWETSGNLCIEYRNNGRRSGIAVTEADFWVHELRKNDDCPLVYFFIPIPHLKKLCDKYYDLGWYRHKAGDDGKSSVILIPLKDVLGY